MKDKKATQIEHVKSYFEKKGLMIAKEDELVAWLKQEYKMKISDARTAIDVASADGVVTRAKNKRVTLYKHPIFDLLDK